MVEEDMEPWKGRLISFSFMGIVLDMKPHDDHDLNHPGIIVAKFDLTGPTTKNSKNETKKRQKQFTQILYMILNLDPTSYKKPPTPPSSPPSSPSPTHSPP